MAESKPRASHVLDRREDGERGSFGNVLDPEGTLIELRQPNPNDPSLNSV